LNHFLSKLITTFILLILFGCASSTLNTAEKKGAVAQNAQEIFDLSNENTLRLISSDFDSYIYFSQDGSMSAKSIFNNNVDYGVWDITEGGKLCLKFNIWYFGDIKCYSIYNDPDDSNQFLLFTSNGALAYTVTASSGNSRHITIKNKKDKKTKYVRKNMNPGASVHKPDPVPVSTAAAVVTSTNIGSSESKEEIRHTVKTMAQNCPDCNFEDADLRQAHLVGANLKNANLKDADLSRANLRRANLEGANLKGATLLSTNLPGANLRNTDLRGADFTGSNLIRADFTGAEIEGCIFDNTLQEGAKGLK
jgi:hypothetical protein